MRKINRIGQRYGKLTVLEAGPTRKGHSSWVCRCDCGNLTTVDSGNLASGHSQSCGHCERYYLVDATTIKCQLFNGDYFLISPEDYEIVSRHKWTIEDTGYPHTALNGRNVRLHKYLMGYDSHIDHISGDKLDNRRSNLRAVSNQQNHWNMKKGKSNTSGYKGVSFEKRRGKYEAYITIDGRKKFLGYFYDPIDAAVAYDNAAFFYFGEYARQNFKKGETLDDKQEVLELDNASSKRREPRAGESA